MKRIFLRHPLVLQVVS